MNKNTSPKARVVLMAEMVRPNSRIEVRGTRLSGKAGRCFLAEVTSNDRVLARARHSDWRKAYKGLEIELSKLGVI